VEYVIEGGEKFSEAEQAKLMEAMQRKMTTAPNKMRGSAPAGGVSPFSREGSVMDTPKQSKN